MSEVQPTEMPRRDDLRDDAVALSVAIPSHNEETNIRACIEAVRDVASEVVVIDSGSSDKTVEIAQSLSAKVVAHHYGSAPEQWKWVLENISFENEWILAIDADYIVSDRAATLIAQVITADDPKISGYYLRHKQFFQGRFIRHGGIYPRYRLCLFRRSKVFVDDLDLVDNRFFVTGEVRRIEADLIEDNHKDRDFTTWMQKQISYGARAAKEEIDRAGSRTNVLNAMKGRNERVKLLKGVWARLPLYWRSVGYFIYRYIIRLGFLDGKEGFLYHFSQALTFRIALDAALEELRQPRR